MGTLRVELFNGVPLQVSMPPWYQELWSCGRDVVRVTRLVRTRECVLRLRISNPFIGLHSYLALLSNGALYSYSAFVQKSQFRALCKRKRSKRRLMASAIGTTACFVGAYTGPRPLS